MDVWVFHSRHLVLFYQKLHRKPPSGISRLVKETKSNRKREREKVKKRDRKRVSWGLFPLKMKASSLWVSFRGEGECYHSCAALVWIQYRTSREKHSSHDFWPSRLWQRSTTAALWLTESCYLLSESISSCCECVCLCVCCEVKVDLTLLPEKYPKVRLIVEGGYVFVSPLWALGELFFKADFKCRKCVFVLVKPKPSGSEC